MFRWHRAKSLVWWCCIIQIQHGIERSSKNYWSRGVGCVRLLPDAKQREVVSRIKHRGTSNFTTSRNKPCCICFTTPHKYFNLKKSLLSIIFWRSSSIKVAEHPLSDTILISNFVLEIWIDRVWSKQTYIMHDLELRRVGSISHAIVRGAIVPCYFPCSHFHEVGQITVMRVSLIWPIIFLGYLINIYEV